MSASAKKENTRKKQKKPRKITPQYLENAGLYYLQRYAASTEHFRFIMRRKIHKSYCHHQTPDLDQCESWLDELINRYQRCGLLNDFEYARQLAISLRRNGKSVRAIEATMKTKQIRPEHISTAIEEADKMHQNDGEFMAALKLIKKKRIGPFRRTVGDEEQPELKKKHLGVLARAGFSYELSAKALSMSENEILNVLYQ